MSSQPGVLSTSGFFVGLRISSKETARPAAPWALLGGAVLKTALRRGWPGAFRERVVTKAVSTVWLAQLVRAPERNSGCSRFDSCTTAELRTRFLDAQAFVTARGRRA